MVSSGTHRSNAESLLFDSPSAHQRAGTPHSGARNLDVRLCFVCIHFHKKCCLKIQNFHVKSSKTVKIRLWVSMWGDADSSPWSLRRCLHHVRGLSCFLQKDPSADRSMTGWLGLILAISFDKDLLRPRARYSARRFPKAALLAEPQASCLSVDHSQGVVFPLFLMVFCLTLLINCCIPKKP